MQIVRDEIVVAGFWDRTVADLTAPADFAVEVDGDPDLHASGLDSAAEADAAAGLDLTVSPDFAKTRGALDWVVSVADDMYCRTVGFAVRGVVACTVLILTDWDDS